ncbi:hypothetical protein QN277_027966 [Acacia crassicarpa]|uniref:Integrase catalytic domain-containing protein n=1 Tax=Acacia crassicarpa TaxID=499986 RepID=A0AAE1J298_9FABA|nr:hypothetical protein QN277_027966 [Acacia crassicarpa]
MSSATSADGSVVSSAVSKTYALFSSSSQTAVIKLDRANFLVWESIVLSLIEGNRLENHIDGTSCAPPKNIPGDTGTRPNPAYVEWFSVDRILVGWLRNTMTIEVGAQLLHCTTAEDLWNGARSLTCASTKARVMVLKNDLHTTHKNSLTMSEYLSKMKSLADELALAGAPVAMDDLILHTLNSLDVEYNAIVAILTDKADTTWIEAQFALLSYESRLTQQTQFSNLSLQPLANVAHHHHTPNKFGNGSRGWSNRGGRYQRGRGGRPFCLHYQRPRHTLATCYYGNDDGYTNSNYYANHYANQFSVADPAWYMDSGANYHVSPDPDHFEEITPSGKSHLITCTGERSPILGIGSATIPCTLNSNLRLRDVLYVPTATKNLLSVNRLLRDNLVHIHFTNHSCDVKDPVTRKLLPQGTPKEGMYPMAVERKPKSQPRALMAARDDNSQTQFQTWHHILGHPSAKILNSVLSKCNKKVSNIHNNFVCEACQLGKSKLLPFTNFVSQASSPFELVHTDLWGPAPIQSHNGHQFYIHFIDDYSHYTWLYPLKHKGEAVHAFKHFKALVENRFDLKIKTLQCDNGSEFKPFMPIAQDAGIDVRLTCPYTSAQNGRAERKHRHIVKMGLTLLAHAGMPLKFWLEAFQHAVYLINRLPSPVLKDRTPLFLLQKTEPEYNQLQPFGCACFPCLKPYNTHKFQFRSQKCIYLGVAAQSKGHRCLSESGRVFISRHVVFDSCLFPFRTGFMKKQQHNNAVDYSSSMPLVIRLNQDTGNNNTQDAQDVSTQSSSTAEDEAEALESDEHISVSSPSQSQSQEADGQTIIILC